jgi:nudix-type nucleoside diphosphatase (YffH/AdpP family)
MTAKITRVEPLHDGWLKVVKAELVQEDGQAYSREIVRHGQAAAVLPYDPDQRVALLVRLTRAPVVDAGVDEGLLEAPAGMLDGDSPEDCARREALEEVGVRLERLQPIASAFTSPGMSTEQTHLFLAPFRAADRIGAGGGVAEEHEDITVVETPLADLWAAYLAGRIADLKTLALLLALRAHHPDLFATRGEAPPRYVGWALDKGLRADLLARFPPAYAHPVADHVTLAHGVPKTAPPPAEGSGEIVGRVDDGAGVEALVVRIGGTTARPDAGVFHITWSLAEGRAAVESNTVLARLGWSPLPEPIPIALIPRGWPD